MNLSNLSNDDLLGLFKTTKQQIAECHNKQMALKILLNGGYGALSNEHNRWYSDDIAESVTLSGQLAARWIIKHLNTFFNKLYATTGVDYVVACDTDSVHLNVEPALIKAFGTVDVDNEAKLEFLEKFARKLESVIADGYRLLSEELNVYEPSMHMKFEAVSQAVWTGKKHYAMEVSIGEDFIRYNPPKLKIVGLEAVKSSTPQIARDWMEQAIPLIIRTKESQVKEFLNEKREEWLKLDFHQIAFPRSISDIQKYADATTIYGKKCPPHVRGALLYNNLVRKMNLEHQLPLISSGDKIRYCYMKMPNPLQEDIFTCPDELPKQFGLEQYIDHHKQFDKAFIEPLMHLIKAAKISMSDDIDISQFF